MADKRTQIATWAGSCELDYHSPISESSSIRSCQEYHWLRLTLDELSTRQILVEYKLESWNYAILVNEIC